MGYEIDVAGTSVLADQPRLHSSPILAHGQRVAFAVPPFEARLIAE